MLLDDLPRGALHWSRRGGGFPSCLVNIACVFLLFRSLLPVLLACLGVAVRFLGGEYQLPAVVTRDTDPGCGDVKAVILRPSTSLAIFLALLVAAHLPLLRAAFPSTVPALTHSCSTKENEEKKNVIASTSS